MSPLEIAAVTVGIGVMLVCFGVIMAAITYHKPDNNGLVMTHEMQRTARKFTATGWH